VAGSRASSRYVYYLKGHQCHALPENNVVKHISIKLVKALVDGALNATTVSFTPVVAASYTDSYIDEAAYYGPGLARRVQFCSS
jgi:hypothetical protein